MKAPLILLVVVAGIAAFAVAKNASEQDYEPVRLEDQVPEDYVPKAIPGPIPAGFQITELTVDGPCCVGCTGKLYAALLELPEVEKASVLFDPEGTLAKALVPAGFDGTALEASLTFDKYSVRSQRVSDIGAETP